MSGSSEGTSETIHKLVQSVGGDPETFEGRLITELIETSLKMIPMRYAYLVFNRYVGSRKISIFGSARTPEDHPDYLAARSFSALMAQNGWMGITGAGDGIMKAGHEGPKREASFGLSIRLPFETTANDVIEGDPKLINFRYFFTRKLMFMSHADAVAVFPGGFGTQDELFESLVLIQTGKSNIVPIVLLEGEGGVYWDHWKRYVRKNLFDNGWISDTDVSFYHIATSPEDAAEHVLRFYRGFHSSRYVNDQLVLRVHNELSSDQVEQLNEEFGGLVKSGRIETSGPLEGETDHLDLPRVVFRHTRDQFAILRRLIDRLGDFADVEAGEPA